jgi:hypothetical protein
MNPSPFTVAPGEYVVAVIVDPAFGEKLHGVATRFDLWIVPSPENQAAVEALWREQAGDRALQAVTIWSSMPDVTSTAEWRGMLQDIEIHHGEYAHDPPVSAIEVIGTDPHPQAIQALAEYGYTHLERSSDGFRASRNP